MPPSDRSSLRLVSWAGFAVVALFVLSVLAVPTTEMLDPNVSAERLAELYRQHRDASLAGLYLGGVTWCAAFLVFAGALSHTVSAAGAPLHAWIGLAGALVQSAAILMFCVLSSTAVYVAGTTEPAVVSMLNDGALLANNFSGFPTIICVATYTLGGRCMGLLPAWAAAVAVLCVAVHALSTVSLAPSGVTSPAGLASTFAPLTTTAWVLAVSIATRRA